MHVHSAMTQSLVLSETNCFVLNPTVFMRSSSECAFNVHSLVRSMACCLLALSAHCGGFLSCAHVLLRTRPPVRKSQTHSALGRSQSVLVHVRLKPWSASAVAPFQASL